MCSAPPRRRPSRRDTTAPSTHSARGPAIVTTWPAAPDEVQVERLVEQLGASSFRARSDAYEKLQQLGPGVLPIVTRRLDDADPEVRQRIQSLIDAYQWMRHGAVVASFRENSVAPKLGIHAGDVVLQINDIDIVDHDFETDVPDAQRTFYLWRQGRLVIVKVPRGTVGLWADDWDIDKGGADQSAGLVALANGQYDQAYELLQPPPVGHERIDVAAPAGRPGGVPPGPPDRHGPLPGLPRPRRR